MEGTFEQLLALDPVCLDDAARLDLLEALDRLMSRASARVERTLAALVDLSDEKQFIREEIRLALRWSDGFTRARCVQATKLVDDLPEALDRHETGELNTAQARALAEATMPLERRHCTEVLERVLPRAGQQTLTEFKNSVTRAVHRVDPRTAAKKHEDDKQRRDVSLRALPNGMAGI